MLRPKIMFMLMLKTNKNIICGFSSVSNGDKNLKELT